MIFGFNTDIKVGDTVYHVQSEERSADRLLQTQIFVKGRCVAKRAQSIASGIESDDKQRHELLRDQHRAVIQSIRDGRVEELIRMADEEATRQASEAAAEAANPLELKFLGSSRQKDHRILLRFSVRYSGSAVTGARVNARLAPESSDSQPAPEIVGHGFSEKGEVEISLPYAADTVQALLTVEATHETAILAKKFRVRTKA